MPQPPPPPGRPGAPPLPPKQPGPPPRGNPSLPTPADRLLMRLVAAERVHALYPRANPNVRAAILRLRETLATFPLGEVIQLDVDRDHVSYRGEAVLPDAAEVQELANRLYLAHVGAIGLEAQAREEELLELLDLLRMAPEKRAALGPLEKVLAAKGVTHVFLREAGRVKIEEDEEEDEDSWDLATLAEIEGLEKKIFPQAGGSGFRDALRAVSGGSPLRASKMIGLLDRPREFAQYMVDLASRYRPHDVVDRSAQLTLLEALVRRMEAFLERLEDEHRTRLYLKLDQVDAWLSTALHKGMFRYEEPPFVRTAAVTALFPGTIRDLDVRESFRQRRPPTPGLEPLLMGRLRRAAEGETRLAGWLSHPVGLAVAGVADAGDAGADLAAYRPVPLPSGIPVPGAPPVPPLTGAPDFLRAAGGGPAAAGQLALAHAVAASVPALDLSGPLVDLLEEETNPLDRELLLGELVTAFTRALETRNLGAAEAALAALRGERERRAGEPGFLAEVDGALARTGGADAMRALSMAIAAAPLGGDELRRAAGLAAAIGPPAIGALLEALAREPAQSVRRKLLDALVSLGPGLLPALSTYATHGQWFVVRNVAWIAGHFGAPAVPLLLRTAGHAEARVRREAVRALARVPPSTEAVRGIVGRLVDPDETVVREALQKLVALHGASPISIAGAVNALVQSPRFAELHYDTMYAVARALVSVGSLASAGLLDGAAESRATKGWLRSPDVKKVLKDAAAAIRARVSAGGGAAAAGPPQQGPQGGPAR